jgi:hypothetical protein
MQLRRRNKELRLNEDMYESKEGASYFRYEVIEKKGSKILVPVRYSVRN